MNDLTMWQDPERVDEIHVLMVDPNNLDSVRGELVGIELSGCSVDFGYYTDNRVSGKVRCFDGGYINYSWLRIVHECPGYSYRNELATLVPTQIAEKHARGSVETDFTLQSTLWSISNDALPSRWTIGKGAMSNDAFTRICDAVNKPRVLLPSVHNYRFTETVAYEIGDTFLSDLFDIANKANNRLDVDGHGRITLGPYVSPSQREPDWDISDETGMIVSGGVDRTTKPGDFVSREIITYHNDKADMVGSADVSDDSPASAAKRGYRVAKTESYNAEEKESVTVAKLQNIAQQNLMKASDYGGERSVTCLYFPAKAGDIIRLTTDGNQSKCLVKDVGVHLSDMTVDLTLKEV